MRALINRLLFVGIMILTMLPTLGATWADAPEPAAGDIRRPPAPTAPHQTYLERVGAWPYGSAQTSATDPARDLVFLSSGGAVLALNATDPTQLTLLSDDIRTLGFVEDLYYVPADQYLYIATGEGGMEIWDLQDPSAPQQLSVTEVYYAGVDVPILGIAVVGDMAYVAADWGWLHWIDVSDPTDPVYAGGEAERLRAEDVDAGAGGNYIYFAGDTGSSVILGDLSKYAIDPDGSLSFVTGINFGLCSSISIWGNYGYLGCGDSYILDVSGAGMSVLSSIPIHTSGTVVTSTHAYLSSGNTGLRAFDVTTPTNPIEVGAYDSPGWANDTALLNGDYVYMTDDHAGLRVVDVTEPTTPTEISFYDTFGWARYPAIQGDYVYLADVTDGMPVIDVSQPTTPTLTGRYQSPAAAYDVAVQGEYAYVADVDNGLYIIDVSNPVSPTEVGALETFDAFRVDVEGEYAYVINSIPNEPYWFRVIDVSNPMSPTEVSAMEMYDDLIWRVVVQGDYAYLAHNDAGLRILDISDPANPVEVGVYSVLSVWDVALQGQYAYVASADWDGGFHILDISDPTNPVLVGEDNLGGWFHPYHVAVSGAYAFVTRDYELYLFDVSDPTNPIDLEQVDLPLSASGLSAAGSYLYAADGEAGLLIYLHTLPLYDAALGPASEMDTPPGTTITHTFTLQNMGLTDRYTLTVSGNTWPTTLLVSSPLTVPSMQEVAVPVQVDVPHSPMEVILDSDTFTITAASAGDPGLVLTTTGTTNALINPGVQISPTMQGQGASPGTVVHYTFTLTNTGDYTDTFDLSISGNSWQTGGPAGTGPLGPGGETPVVVSVTVPYQPIVESTIIASDTFTLTGTSVADPAVSAQATGTTDAVVQPAPSLTLPITAGMGEVGTTVSYPFTITNGGDYTDTLHLTGMGHWPLTLSLTSTGWLPVGGSVTGTVWVQVPMTIADGEQDVAVLTATSIWDGEATTTAQVVTTGVWKHLFLPLVLRSG